MTTIATAGAAPSSAARATTVRALAALEARRYATHPLFLIGIVATVALNVSGPEADTSTLYQALAPAAAIGLAGIVIMWNMARRSDAAARTAGAAPVGERTRTLALAGGCAVPFAAGLAWWAYALIGYELSPPPANGFPFGPADDLAWVAAVLFALGPLACIGAPLLGLLVARWTTGRAAPAIAIIVVVALAIVMQGVFDPLIRVRVIMPWTWWGGPGGVEGDPERMKVFPGSPYWWVLYVACLSALGLILALLHDRERPRRPLLVAGGAVLAVAVAACLLAMWTGIPDTLVNPLRSDA
jgi:hypothetical protein